MTGLAPHSPDRNGGNGNDNLPTSPVKASNDDEDTVTPTEFSGSSQSSDPKSNDEPLPLLREEESSSASGDGKKSIAEELLNENDEDVKPPATPDRTTKEAPFQETSSPILESSEHYLATATTPVRTHVSIDHTGNLSEERDSLSPLQPILPPPSMRRAPPSAPSPIRSSVDGWLTGINNTEKEEKEDHSNGESTKNPKTLMSEMSTKTDFGDELLNTTMPETPTHSEDGSAREDGRPEPPSNLKKKKLNLEEDQPQDPLERLSNKNLSALFGCLVISILVVVMFLIYVVTQPPILPPTPSPTLSVMPSEVPSSAPTDWVPSASPSARPSRETQSPSDAPSANSSSSPSSRPTRSPTPMPSTMPSPTPTYRDPAEDLSFLLGTYSDSLKTRIQQDVGSKQRAAFEWLIRDPEFYTYDETRLIQRYVLALFRLEMKVPTSYRRLRGQDEQRNLNWNSLESWMQYTDECTWFTSYYLDRVGCDRTGTWKRLVLYHLDLEGTIPSELALLSRMDTLILSNHTLTGTIPRELYRLPMLQTLDLSGNRLSGMIPTELARLTDLEELSLARNQLGNTIPTQFVELKKLRLLDISDNGIIGRLYSELATLRQLEVLRVEKNFIGNSIPVQFSTLNRLKELDVSNNGILGTLPSEFGALQALTTLDVSHNAMVGSIPSEIGLLKQLSRLSVGYNRMTGTIPFNLGLYNLHHIDVSNNQFIGTLPARFGSLSELTYLDISGNPMSGPFPREVCNLVRSPVYNKDTNLYEKVTMFKANCAFVGCSCCTDCV